jgi:hypothetical protein
MEQQSKLAKINICIPLEIMSHIPEKNVESPLKNDAEHIAQTRKYSYIIYRKYKMCDS